MARIALPDAPAVVAGHGRAAILTADGELLLLARGRGRRSPAHPAAADAGSCARDIPPARPARHAGIRPAGAVCLRPACPSRRAHAARPRPDAGFRPADRRPGSRGGAAAGTCRRLAAPALARPRHRPEPRRRGSGGAHGRRRAGAGRRSSRLHSAGPMRRRRTRRCACGSACRNGRTPRRCRRLPRIRWAEAEARSRLAAMLGPARGAAAGPGRLRRRRRRGLRATRNPRRSASRAGRGRHRNRQDARLPRARQRVGREEPRQRVDQHLHPPPAAPDRRGTDPSVPRPDRTAQARRGAQGPGELPLPAQPGGRAGRRHLGAGAGVGHPARPDCPLGAGHRRWRHPGGRSARLARRTVRRGHRSSAWPTGAANASTPPARTGGAASSSTRSAGRAPRSLSLPTTPW